jgi:hypothetical protein
VSFILSLMALLLLVVLLVLNRESRREAEPVAARRSLLALLVGVPVLLVVAWVPLPGGHFWGWSLISAAGFFGLWLFWPGRLPTGLEWETPVTRHDERQTMFSRAELVPGSARFAEYYRENPGHRPLDDHWRKLPGLLNPEAGKFERLSFSAAAASFRTVEFWPNSLRGSPLPRRSRFLRRLLPGSSRVGRESWGRWPSG